MPAATVTRSALYDLVWSEPMLRLAKRYGISDVGLAKVCRKHNIPRPPRGYWARKAAGKAPAQIPLPDPENDSSIHIAGFGVSSAGAAVNGDIRELIEESAPPFRIKVRDHLRGAHALVNQTRRELQAPRVDREGLIILPDDLPLDLRVSKATLRRALLLMDALLRALEEHGDAVSAGPRVTLLGIPVRFGITEILETHREEAEPDDFTGLYRFSYNRVRSKRIPSGAAVAADSRSTGIWSAGCPPGVARYCQITTREPAEVLPRRSCGIRGQNAAEAGATPAGRGGPRGSGAASTGGGPTASGQTCRD